jgi:hypothetical protein
MYIPYNHKEVFSFLEHASNYSVVWIRSEDDAKKKKMALSKKAVLQNKWWTKQI